MADLNDFLLSHSWSNSTVDRYRRSIQQFTKTFSDLTIITPQLFSNWLNSFNWSSSTRWIAFTSVRLYLRWLYGDSHPALKLKIKRFYPGPQRTLNIEQVKKLLYSFNTSCPKGRRDLSICSLFLDSGLRCSEICNLEIKNLHIDQLSLNVIIKGGTWQSAVFSPYTGVLLQNWIQDRIHIAQPGLKTLYCSIGGTKHGTELTRSGLQRIVKYWGQSLGFALSPHDFRRTFATLAIQAGAPSRVLQVAGRWSNISMVERYTRAISLGDFKNYFPMDLIMRD